MYQNKKILAIIPARGGSKGVPRKNIKNFCGKPLIAWTIEQAKKSEYIDKCIVSTEDDEIKEVAEKYGGYVPFVRPKELAQDDTPGIEPVIHAIKMLPNYDFIVLLQVTSPFRLKEDIDGAIKFCFEKKSDSCISMTQAEVSPYWMYSLSENDVMKPILQISKEKSYQRQKLPPVYQLNGAVYVASVNLINEKKSFSDENTVGYLMPQERSFDIDNLTDFEIAEFLMQKRIEKF